MNKEHPKRKHSIKNYVDPNYIWIGPNINFESSY